MEELWQEVNRLYSTIREHEREINRVFSEMQHLQEPWTAVAVETQALSIPGMTVMQGVKCEGESEEWKLLTSGIKRSRFT